MNDPNEKRLFPAEPIDLDGNSDEPLVIELPDDAEGVVFDGNGD